MSDEKDANGLLAAIDTIAETAEGALKSGAVAENDQEELQLAIKAFKISVAAILKDMSDQSKINLVSIINGAFTIGMTCGLSETVVNGVTNYNKHRHAAKMRAKKAQQPKRIAREKAITAVLGDRRPDSNLWAEATKLLPKVNKRLESDGFDRDTTAKPIYESLQTRSGTPRSTRAREK